MWLLSAFPAVASLATRIFYRVHVSGARVPGHGPVLLVANHPNALLDPFLVISAAGRPVHFLAKAPLFSDALIGWAVRAVGALPVYRRREDPAQMGRNEETFRAVHSALSRGAAVGIFPEGISHDEPFMAPLKTGAARIALGAAPLTGGAFPIVPIGLVFESKHEFRSVAYVVIGEPVDWSDLTGVPPENQQAVRQLTARIETALHDVTLNLQRHEDAPLIAAATAVYSAEVEPADSPEEEAVRRIVAAKGLAQLSAEGDAAAVEVAGQLRQHMRTLAVLGLSPPDLHRRHDVAAAARWTARRMSPGALPTAMIAAAGTLLFWLPYRATGWLASRHPARDFIATLKLLYGVLFFLTWIVLLALVVWLVAGWPAGIAALLMLPVLALKTVSYSEQWTAAARDVRSFLVRRGRRERVEKLRAAQQQLGRDLRALYLRLNTASVATLTGVGDPAVRS